MPAILQKFFPFGLVLLALVVGLLHAAPGFLLWQRLDEQGRIYLPLQLAHHGDSVLYYLGRAQEIVDGHFPPSDLSIPENKRLPYLYPPLPQLFFAGFIWLTGDATRAYLAALVFFPAALTLLFYWMGQALLQHRAAALLLAFIGTLTPVAFILPRTLFSPQLLADTFLKDFFPLVRTPLHDLFLGRFDEPLLTFWLYVAAFTALYVFWRAATIRNAFIAGITAGLLFYTYFYYWVFMVTLLGLLALVDFRRNKWAHLSSWLILLGVVLLLSVPHLINFWELRALPQGAERLARLGLEHGRGLRLSVWPYYLSYFAFAAASFFLLRRADRAAFAFFGASLVAVVLLWNLQLFIGFNIHPDHWPRTFALPLFALSTLLAGRIVSLLGERFNPVWFRRALLTAFVLAMVLLTVKKLVNAAIFGAPSPELVAAYSFPPPVFDSWKWLRENTPSDATILTNSFVTATYIAAYTSANPYFSHSENTIAANRMLEDRFLAANKLFGAPAERLRQLLTAPRDFQTACPTCDHESVMNLFKTPKHLYHQTYNVPQNTFDAITRNPNYAIPQEKVDELLVRYNAMNPRWEDFRGAYVYYGPREREIHAANFKANPRLDLHYDSGGIEIYRVK